MPNPSFPLATSSWDSREHDAIQRVVTSGRFTMGPEVAAFEREFSRAIGSTHSVMVNSGSSANLLIIAALRFHSKHQLSIGDEVVVPAVSWSTTFSPLYQHGLSLRFVDVDPDTLNIDLDAVKDAITDSTRAVFAVNLLGNPNDFDRLKLILGKDIILLEDNCESLGATFGGRQAGTFGLAGSYSTFFSHHISTMEGGVAVTDDEELYHIMLCLRAHGWTRDLPRKNQVMDTTGRDPFQEAFRFALPGYNLRPLELSGAIGREQIAKLPMIVRERRANANRFRNLMASFPELRIQQETGESSWFGFSMIIRENVNIERQELVNFLQRKGIECRPIVAGNFAKNKAVTRYLDHTIHGDLRHADHLDRQGLFVGNHHYLLDQQLELLGETLAEVFGH